MSLRDRITRLEAQTTSEHEPLTEADREKLANSMPNDVLRHYLYGDLDKCAVLLSGISAYLHGLQDAGFAIEIDGHWHPLFIGDDAEVNEQVIARIEQLNDERINAAIKASYPRA
jgi:hypothetical protein